MDNLSSHKAPAFNFLPCSADFNRSKALTRATGNPGEATTATNIATPIAIAA